MSSFMGLCIRTDEGDYMLRVDGMLLKVAVRWD